MTPFIGAGGMGEGDLARDERLEIRSNQHTRIEFVAGSPALG